MRTGAAPTFFPKVRVASGRVSLVYALSGGTDCFDRPETLTLAALASVFALVFVGELPDKTMFASLVMASRGRPVAVWFGAAAAFVVHVAIAVTVGVAIFHLFGHRVVEVVVAVTFMAGAVLSFVSRNTVDDEPSEANPDIGSSGSGAGAGRAGRFVSTPAMRTASMAAGVIFVAEWGDLTQIIIANLAARYHDPIPVAVASLAALWVVAALAVASGKGLLAVVSPRSLRIVAAVVLAGLAAYTALGAVGLRGPVASSPTWSNTPPSPSTVTATAAAGIFEGQMSAPRSASPVGSQRKETTADSYS